MKYIKKNICGLLCLLILQSCDKSYEGALRKIVEQEKIPHFDKYNAMVIIPGSGCTGCITQAENYFLQNCHDTSTLFILTYNLSLKEVSLRLKEENINKENVIIDKSNKFYLSRYQDAICPIVCTLDKGRIINIRKLN